MRELLGGTGGGSKITKVWVEGVMNQGNADAGAEVWRGAAARIVCEQYKRKQKRQWVKRHRRRTSVS